MAELNDKVRKIIVSAVNNYDMIEEGDKIMVCVSGGKDSTILLYLLEQMRQRSKINFTVEGVLLNQKQPGFRSEEYCRWMEEQGLKLTIIEKDTYSIVTEKVPAGKTYCSLCSRLRRGILYNHASEHGFTKMALGHHRDDINQTLLLNLFFAGKLSSMPPKLLTDDKRNVVIRPMSYVPESMLMELEQEMAFPTIPCNLCGSQDGMQRQKMKEMLRTMEKDIPNLANTMLNAQKNIRKSQLLDRDIWDFSQLIREPNNQ